MDQFGNIIHYKIQPENDEGDVEYKWSLVNLDKNKRTKISSQMKWRVNYASDINSALYILGVHDNGSLTGLKLNVLLQTIINLMDCAHSINMFTCIKVLKSLKNTDNYWAIIQVFRGNRKYNCDFDKPLIPDHSIPDYLINL